MPPWLMSRSEPKVIINGMWSRLHMYLCLYIIISGINILYIKKINASIHYRTNVCIKTTTLPLIQHDTTDNCEVKYLPVINYTNHQQLRI